MCQVGVWWGGKASLISYPNKRARRGLNFIPTEPAATAITALFDREEAPEQLRKKVNVVSINAVQEPSGQQALPGEQLALLVQSAFPVEPLPIQQTVRGEPLDQSAIPGEPFVQPVASWLTQLPQGSPSPESRWLNQLSQWSHLFSQLAHCWLNQLSQVKPFVPPGPPALHIVGSASCPRRAFGSTSCPSGAVCSISCPFVGSASAVTGEPLAQPAVPVEPFVPPAAQLLAHPASAVTKEPLAQPVVPVELFVPPASFFVGSVSFPRRAFGSTSCPSGAICSTSCPIVGSALIDQMFCKVPHKQEIDISSSIIISRISDHFLCIVNLRTPGEGRKQEKLIYNRTINDSAINDFREELSRLDILSRLNANMLSDPNIDYGKFEEVLSATFNKHFPEKRIKVNKYKRKLSPWITTGIIKSIEFRDNLYMKLKACTTKSPEYKLNQYNLKIYNGYLRQCIRAAKKQHYTHEFAEYKNDIRKTLDTLTDIMNKKKSKVESPTYFLNNGKYVCGAKILLISSMSTSLK